MTHFMKNNDPNVKHVNGHGVTGPHGEQYGSVVDAMVLAPEKGNYLIMVGDHPYASERCRCPALDADVFLTRAAAKSKLEELTADAVACHAPVYAIKKITDTFLEAYARRDKKNDKPETTTWRGG